MLLYGYFLFVSFFFFNVTATTEIYTLSLHDALPISFRQPIGRIRPEGALRSPRARVVHDRSEEHTSELQSRRDLVCRLLLEKKKEHIYIDKYMRQLRTSLPSVTDIVLD